MLLYHCTGPVNVSRPLPPTPPHSTEVTGVCHVQCFPWVLGSKLRSSRAPVELVLFTEPSLYLPDSLYKQGPLV